jgi:GTP 3',8-cyclase
MPSIGIPLSPQSHLLTTPEILHLSSLFVSNGVSKIRLTGGEPTLRKDLLDVMDGLNALKGNGLKEICMTSNGLVLGRKGRLEELVDRGLTGLNLRWVGMLWGFVRCRSGENVDRDFGISGPGGGGKAGLIN